MINVKGDDSALAAAIDGTDSRIRFVPTAASDLARAIGLVAGHAVAVPTTVDVLSIEGDGYAVNMIVMGPPPDQLGRYHRMRDCVVEVDGRAWEGAATTVLLANGEYLRGNDVVPRGHPADGRFEVHVYAVPPAQRGLLRARLPAGTHVPHPGIKTFQGTRAFVRWDRPVLLEIDGSARDRVTEVEVTIQPGALHLEA